MLVRGSTNDVDMLNEMAMFLAGLSPDRAYLSIPTRPPAESWVKPPVPEEVNTAFQIFSEKIDPVEYLIGYEGNAFAFTGNVEKDLLSITSVHPMRESAVSNFLAKAGKDWTIINKLISKEKIVETEYNGQKFYVRNFNTKPAG
jgi:wyosine [tRNA(Phe)-imidazoG37] synthetase (radical SAM superfamily)